MKKIFVFMMMLIAGLAAVKAVEPSGTLPVLYINIDNGAEVEEKGTYLKAGMWLDSKGCEGVESLGSQEAPLTLQIKGRGNYTWSGFEKKPYRLKLDAKAALLGMKKSKHFGLLAHADDNRGFLRNTIGFEVSKRMGLPWTPEQRPVELVINGTYRGLYLLTELIRIDEDRVNIKPWKDEYTDENGKKHDLIPNVEGGTIVEIDNYTADGQVSITDGDGEKMRLTYDKSVDPGFEPAGYTDWLRSQFETMNRLIFGDKNSDELWNYLDLDDCARFILVQEITCNYESFHGSCYLHREYGDGNKWHFSPVWDFGSAFNDRSQTNKHFWECSEYHNHWVAQLVQFPKLKARMAELYAQYKANDAAAVDQYAASFISQIANAAARDKERWPQYGNSDLQDKLNSVKGFLSQKGSYLSSVYSYTAPIDPENFVVPEDETGVFHLFFEATGNAADWSKVCFHYWGNGQTEWPGNDCTLVKVDGKSYWHFEYRTADGTDNVENVGIIFNDGASYDGNEKVDKYQTDDLKPTKRGVYRLGMDKNSYASEQLPVGGGNQGGEEGGDTPQPGVTIPENVYIVGTINGHNWDPENAPALTKSGNSFSISDVELTDDGYFSFITALNGGASDWATTNAALRIGAGSSDAPVTLTDGKATLEAVAEINGNMKAWKVGAGTYNFTVTFADDKVSVYVEKAGGGDTPVVNPAQEINVVFIDNHSTPWENVSVWVWDADRNNTCYCNWKEWPGDPMTKQTAQAPAMRAASNTWHYLLKLPEGHSDKVKIIFNNGQKDNTQKSDNLDYVKNQVYERNDDNKVVAGVEAVAAGAALDVRVVDGMLVVTSPSAMALPVASIDGRVAVYQLLPGVTVISLERGVYIVNGRKYAL